MRNSTEIDNFPDGFYLHNLESLVNNTLERDKFSTYPCKQDIDDLSPQLSLIYEVPNSLVIKSSRSYLHIIRDCPNERLVG